MDPFSIRPCEFNLGVLKAVEPFLRIHEQPSALRNSGLDKFQGGKIPPDVLKGALELIGVRLAEAERKYTEQRTEGNLRPLHIEMIGLVEPFTMPTEIEFEALTDLVSPPATLHENYQSGFRLLLGGEDNVPMVPAGISDVPGVDVSNVPKEGNDDNALSEHQDNTFSEHQDNRRNSSGSSSSENEGMKLDTEHPPQGPDNVLGRGRTDCRLFVHDNRQRPELSDFVKSELSTQWCGMLGEFKKDEDPEAISQAGGYARHEILRNLSNKHYRPVYLLVFSKTKFTYAVINYEGKIRTSGRKLSDAAYEAFCESCKDPMKCTSREILDEIYKSRTDKLRAFYKPNVCYPLRDYIVGDMYLAPEWYVLPTTKTESGMISLGARKLYEGLLRIAVGDIILNWNFMDMLTAYGRRKIQSHIQASIGGLDIQSVMRQELLLFSLCGAANAVEDTEDDSRARGKRARLFYGMNFSFESH